MTTEMELMQARKQGRREELLSAAARAIAKEGYDDCRVCDIAREAGVSPSLVYHYFASKEEVFESIFRENWGIVAEAIEQISRTGDSGAEKLRKIAAVMLHSWRHDPDVVRVLVREVSRNPNLQAHIGALTRGLDQLQGVIKAGQQSGEFDPELDPLFATYAAWGVLDEIMTGWVLGRLPDGPDDVERALDTVVRMFRGALAAR